MLQFSGAGSRYEIPDLCAETSFFTSSFLQKATGYPLPSQEKKSSLKVITALSWSCLTGFEVRPSNSLQIMY